MGYKVNPPSSEELRQLAVRRLGAGSAHDGATLTVEQAKQLLEEVAISKVEVEIQNVYLQDTCARLDVALNEITDLYDFAPIGCLSADVSGRITKLNLTGASYFGQERNTLMGRLFTDFFAPGQQDKLHAMMRQASASGEDQQCDLTLQTGKNMVQHVQLVLSPQGAGQGYHMVLNNITARKALEDDLRANEERWKFALDATGDGVWDWDVHADTMRYSAKLAQLYGSSSAGFDHGVAGWRERVHPDDWSILMNMIQRCLTGQEQRFSNEHRGRCADGSWKWIQCQGAVFGRDGAGKVTRMIGTHSDISARKQMEAELQDARGIQRALFDSFPQYLAVLDEQGRVLQTNDLWNAHGLANGFAYRNGFTQTAYAVLLDSMTGGEGETKRAALAGIGDVVAGRVPGFQLEYACRLQGEPRRYIMHVMAVREGSARAVVAHQDLSRMEGATPGHCVPVGTRR